ncbi:IclR family transcriptional regulator [Actinomadura physcomitrii]|uniref:IclR family transcriptional regulator n=1 Tax=Actinomadura physcomitrii TaxID=2650748 RepID=UPI001924FB2A|nr:IclR family transcriptional regulator [Actinomadura physcomitrii]
MSSRLLDLLFSFEPGATELSVADLSRRTGLPHPTTRRLVIELAKAGALEQRADGRFTVGIRLWQLGTLAPLTESLRTTAQPFMEDLYTALHQHVQLAVLEGTEAVIIDRLSAPRALGLVSRVGGRLPLHCSGVGKVLLSHAGTRVRQDVLDGELRSYTPQTVTDPQILRRELAECRRTGTAMVRGEMSNGADSVATRILDGDGRVVASLSVVVRSGSVRPQTVLPSVITSGLGISRRLGWRPGVKVRDG